MKKFNLFVFRIKKNLLSIIFLLFTICLIIFSSNNVQATKMGLKLWANSVVPSLYPFFIAVELLSYTNIPNLIGKIFTPIMKPLFNISRKRCICVNYGMD